MREIAVRKKALHEAEQEDDLRGKSLNELLGMMWQLTLDAWAFKEKLDAEPRLQKHVVVVGRGKSHKHEDETEFSRGTSSVQ